VTVDVGEHTLAIAEQRQWLSAALAARHPGDGSQVDQSCIVSIKEILLFWVPPWLQPQALKGIGDDKERETTWDRQISQGGEES